MEIGEMWADGVDRVTEGEVRTWDGRVVPVHALIQRRWGWPKKAARAAGELLRTRARGKAVTLWVTNPMRHEQQLSVLAALPDVLADLFSGLARGASREALDADHMIHGVEVVFDHPISDDGLISEVTAVLANRLGTSSEAVRAATQYDTSGQFVTMAVRTSVFEP